MKLTIKEIMEKCETDDKINFKGIVEKVWQFNEKKTKYSIGYQNIIVKDETGSIKVIFSQIKTEEDIYQSNIEGNEVEVSGKVSIYNGQTNIFGKLIFVGGEVNSKESADRESGIKQLSPVAELHETRPAGITRVEARIKCLEIATVLFKADLVNTVDHWITAAKEFEEYIYSTKKTKSENKTTNRAKPKEKIKKTEEELSQDKIKQINTLMAIVENRGAEGRALINKIVKDKGYNSIKDFNESEIKEANKKLEQMGTEEIPF